MDAQAPKMWYLGYWFKLSLKLESLVYLLEIKRGH